MEFSSTDTTKLAKAMIAVQKDMAPATKDATNPFCKNRYATLNSVMDACRPALNAHGIWLTQLPMPAPIELGAGHIGLLTKLTHVDSGQWQASFTVAPLPKNDPQGFGSALTYCRRYALTAMLGMVMEDDDGNAASNPEKPTVVNQRSQSRNQQQAWNSQAHQADTRIPNSPANNGLPPDIPQLDGVKYQVFPDESGREFVIASGNTLPKKEILQGAGFRWNPNDKVWWRYLNAA